MEKILEKKVFYNFQKISPYLLNDLVNKISLSSVKLYLLIY